MTASTADMRLSVVVEAIDRLTEPFRRMGGAVGGMARNAGSAFEKLEGSLQRVGNSYAGFAASIGAGLGLREIIKENDALSRLATDAGIGGERMKELREAIDNAAAHARVPLGELDAGFRNLFNLAGIGEATRDVDALAQAIQRLGGHGDALGDLFGTLEKYGDVKGPKRLAQAMAMLREQIGPNSQFLVDFAGFAPRLISGYDETFNASGLGGLRDLGALFGALRPIAHRPGEAAVGLGALLDKMMDTRAAGGLQSLFHVPVLGRSEAEAEANYRSDKRRPISEWLPQLVDAVHSSDVRTMDELIGQDLRKLLNKMSAADVTKRLNATGDVGRYLKEVEENSETTKSALDELITKMDDLAHARLDGPLKELTKVLQKFPDEVAAVVVSLGAFSLFGTAAGSVRLLTAALEGAAGPLGLVAVGLGLLYEYYQHWDEIKKFIPEAQAIAGGEGGDNGDFFDPETGITVARPRPRAASPQARVYVELGNVPPGTRVKDKSGDADLTITLKRGRALTQP